VAVLLNPERGLLSFDFIRNHHHCSVQDIEPALFVFLQEHGARDEEHSEKQDAVFCIIEGKAFGRCPGSISWVAMIIVITFLDRFHEFFS
jgi:hypothetical protein